MRELIRPAGPACLQNYDYRHDGWSIAAPTHVDRQAVWQALLVMQGDRCAYCEAALGTARHIEHFRSRSRCRELTFDWDNLFGSCNNPDSCGKHKDHQGRHHNPSELLKPDVDAPHQSLRFFADGRVEPRAGLPSALTRKASETIRVFNLDQGGALRARRREAVRPFLDFLEALDDMRPHISEDDAINLIDAEMAIAAGAAHAGAIRQVLMG